MSFILDALQKDQVEQQPQAAPTGALPPPLPSPAKRWGPWLIGAALLVNAGVLAWYLLSQPSNSANPAKVAPSVPGAQRELAIARPEARANPAPSQDTVDRAMPRRTPDRSTPNNSIAEPTRERASRASRAQPTRSSTPAPASSNGAGRVLSPEQAAQMGIGDDLLNAPTNSAPQAERSTTSKPAVASSSNNTNASPNPKSVPASNTITIAELPAAARSSFPELEFSTHIFADDPSMRAVVVNDKRLTEGEQLGELILRAVTEDGVVFGYRNHRVAVSVVDLWAE